MSSIAAFGTMVILQFILQTIMNAIRAFNVITLSLILVLVGCFGASDGTVSAEENDELNSAPVLDATSLFQEVVCTNTSCSIDVYHAAVDPDGDSFDLGWDLDLDGVIDTQLNTNRGIETIQIPTGYFVSAITDQYVESSQGVCENSLAIVTETTYTVASQITTIALLAEDSNGATSGYLHTVAGEETMTNTSLSIIVSCQSLDLFTWNSNDASGNMGDSTNDALIEVTMASGSALDWSRVAISISVDGGTPQACSDDAAASCTYTTFESGNDQAWEAGEGITIMENGQDLCDGEDGGCAIKVTITMKGIGNAADKGIGIVNTYADALQ